VPTSGGSRSIPGVEDPQPMATDTYAIGHPPNQRTLFIQFYHTPDWDISVTVTFPGTSPLPPFIIRNDSEATPVLEHIRALLESPNVA